MVEHIGVFGRDTKGWTKELNRVAWNGGPAKYDIRSWDEGHHKMGRGITLTKQELNDLKNIFDQVD
ncbi:MAG: PC4/YdbC family ssDNA-binding protein [Bacteroidales bacterium]|nr:PC4/YdbC family ssDNA-binding protein [Bacteroidales bacterium]